MPLVIEYITAVVCKKAVGFVQPILHAHQLLVLCHQFGVVDEHGHQSVELGQLFFVEVVLGHQRIALENFAVGRTFPSGQSHGRTVQRCPLSNQLGSGLAGHGKVQLVLHKGIKILGRLTILVIVIAALLKHIGNLLVGAALAGADLTDALEQFIKVVPTKGLAVFEHVIVEYKAFLDVLFECLGCPLAEAGGFLGVDPIAHGDNGIKIIVVQRTAHLSGTLLTNYRNFLGSCLGG